VLHSDVISGPAERGELPLSHVAAVRQRYRLVQQIPGPERDYYVYLRQPGP